MKYNKHKFTLMELLVAMGVFSILLVLSMQFFTSAQRMWTSTEYRNSVYSEANLIMNLLVSKLMQMDVRKEMPFEMKSDNNKTSILFATGERLESRGDKYDTRYYLFNFYKNKLTYQIFSDSNGGGTADFEKYLPPFDATATAPYFKTTAEALGKLKEKFDFENTWDSESDTKDKMHLCENVINFTLTAYNLKENGFWDKQSNTITTPPDMIELSLSIMGKQAYEHWLKLKEIEDPNSEQSNAENYRLANTHTFTRNIYFTKQ